MCDMRAGVQNGRLEYTQHAGKCTHVGQIGQPDQIDHDLDQIDPNLPF